MNSKAAVSGSVDIRRIRGLLFDVDGTLSNTDDHMVDRLARFLDPISWLFAGKDARRFARWFVMASETPINFFYSLADRLGLDEPISQVYNRLAQKRRTVRAHQDRFWIIPGIRDKLAALSEHYPMAVVSARDKLSTNYFLEHFELSQYFKVIVTSQTCEHTKPYPDPVIHAAGELGFQPQACLMIGDTIVDVHAGRLAGAQTAAVLCGFGTQQELKRAGADMILASTLDILSILASNDK